MSFQRLTPHVADNARDHIAAPLQHAEHRRLAWGATAALPTLTLPADHGFVGFGMAVKRVIAVHLGHVLANLVPHAPRSFVGDAQLALKFLSRHAMPRRGEQVHGVEPLLEWSTGSLERRSNHRMDVMTAPFARIRGLLFQLVELGFAVTARAIQNLAVAKPHQVVETGFICRKPLVEVCNRERFSHCRNFRYRQYSDWSSVGQGDNQ